MIKFVPGENKNRYVLGYLSWRTLVGLHKNISLSMQVPYHGRCLVDAGFGHIKRLYRRSDVDSLSSMINVVDKSAKSNVLVGYENPRNGEHNWEWCNWKNYSTCLLTFVHCLEFGNTATLHLTFGAQVRTLSNCKILSL